MEFDPYAILGVQRDCNADELKSAYRRLARENHPDIARDKNAATLRMTQINAAWTLVGDPQKRASFDARWRLDEFDRQRATASQRFTQERSASAPRPHPQPQPHPAPPARSSKAKTSRSASSSGGGSHRPTSTRAATPTAAKSKSVSRRTLTSSALRHAKLIEASNLLKQNKPNETIRLCKAILKFDFHNSSARELMGDAYLALGQTEQALAAWETALIIDPMNLRLRRRWLSLMPPEERAVHEHKGTRAAPAMPRATNMSRSASQAASSPGFLSRLVSRLKKR